MSSVGIDAVDEEDINYFALLDEQEPEVAAYFAALDLTHHSWTARQGMFVSLVKRFFTTDLSVVHLVPAKAVKEAHVVLDPWTRPYISISSIACRLLNDI